MTRSRLPLFVAVSLGTVLVVGGALLGFLHWSADRTRPVTGAADASRPVTRTSPSATPMVPPKAGPTRRLVAAAGQAGLIEPKPTVPPQPRRTRHVFPIADCSASYGTTHHDYPAADMFAERNCVFVSPVSGHVDEVSPTDRWSSSVNDGSTRGGRSVSIVGDDGVRYYGAHLTAVLAGIRPGARVVPGQPLGRVGDSGSARGTGTHLHFGISWPTGLGHWWIRRGAVAPQPFLDAWRAGRDLSPATAVAAARRSYGDDSRCHVYC